MLEPLLPANHQLAEAFSETDDDGRQRSLMGAIELVTPDRQRRVVVAQCGRGRLDIRSIVHSDLKTSSSSSSTAAAPFEEEVSAEVAAEDVAVTALLWLPPNPNSAMSKPMLCLGFSHGGVTIFSFRGKPCTSFLLCQRPVVCLRPGLGSGSSGDIGQLLVLHEGNELASVSLAGIYERAAAVDSGEVDAPDALPPFAYDAYQLRDREEAAADICVFASCRPLEDVFESDMFPCAVAVGARPFLSQHVIIGGNNRSLFANAATAAKAVFSIAKSFWQNARGTGSSNNTAPAEQLAFDPLDAPLTLPPAGLLSSATIQVQQASPVGLPAAGRFLDSTRVALKPLDKPYPCDSLVPAPPLPSSSTFASCASALAATCDDFGRVGLFCLETMRCLHLWKGYRDAQVAWLREPATELGMGCALGLVIYAPKRGLLELWDIAGDGSASPKRLDAVVVDMDCRLLACPCGLWPTVYLLRPSGRLDSLRWNPESESAPPQVANIAVSDTRSECFESVSSEGDGLSTRVDEVQSEIPVFRGSSGYPQEATDSP